MPKKNNRTPPAFCRPEPVEGRACIHLYNPPVPPAGYLTRPRSIAIPTFPQNEPNPRCWPAKNTRNKPNLPRRHRPHDPNMRNEPNSRIPGVPPLPISAKRTQSPDTQAKAKPLCINDLTKIGDSYLFLTIRRLAHDQNTRNKPNSPVPSVPPPQKCETNPIYPAATIPTTQICETNPISSRGLPQICETNPIFNQQYTFYNIQYTTLWPNFQPQIYNLQYTLYSLRRLACSCQSWPNVHNTQNMLCSIT